MKPQLLISKKIIEEFEPRLTEIINKAPRPIELLPFEFDLLAAERSLALVEMAYYSRDFREQTGESSHSDCANAFWSLLDRTPGLKWIHVFSSGTDRAQYQQMLQRGIRLTTSAGAQAEAVGMAAVSGLLALARRLPHYWAAQQRREWAPLRGSDMPRDLGEQTAIIVGTGQIGAVIGRVLKSCGLRTIGIRRHVAPVEHFDQIMPPSALDAHLPQCDWLVLACPLSDETRGLIDARRLALLPQHAGLVNIARGELVDEQALLAALSSKALGCAFLDVFAVEPLAPESPFWRLPNVLISPHNAGASSGTYARGVEIFLRNLDRYLGNQPLRNEARRSA